MSNEHDIETDTQQKIPKPFVLNDKPTVYFDVDCTLVDFTTDTSTRTIKFRDRRLKVNWPLVEIVKDYHARGHNVIVWSAGGASWAHSIVEVLKLTEYVHLIINKPSWFYDDLKAEQFMPEVHRVHVPFN